MEATNQSVVKVKDDGSKVEDMFFTYSPEEVEENNINRENAAHVFSPEFIPYYLGVEKEFGLTPTETKAYGFIRFYHSSCTNRFYFTDEQLGLVLNCNGRTAGESVRKLSRLGLIKLGHKIRAGGGTIRFVKDVKVPSTSNLHLGITPNLHTNNNNINNNIVISKDITESNTSGKDIVEVLATVEPNNHKSEKKSLPYGNQDINKLTEILKEWPVPLKQLDDRRRVSSLLKVLSKSKASPNLDEDWRVNFRAFMDYYRNDREDKYYARSVKNLTDEVKAWRNLKPQKVEQKSWETKFKFKF